MGTVHLHPRSPARAATLADYARDLDARRYRCPDEVDRRIGCLLGPSGVFRVLEVTGRGGSGKSAALREVARRAQGAGWAVLTLDARVDDVIPAVEALAGGPPRVVVVDEAGVLGPAMGALGRALGNLPGDSRLVVAGRVLPRQWLPDPFEALVLSVQLGSLDRQEADTLLCRHGIDDPRVRDRISDWARGLPLALVVGATAWKAIAPEASGPRGEGAVEQVLDRLCSETLVRRLGAEPEGSGCSLVAALEGFHSDALLAALPVAPPGLDVPMAAEHVRVWVRTRTRQVLADHPELLDLVRHRYLTAGATHQSAIRATYLSRATYFRRLRRARELLVVPGPRL